MASTICNICKSVKGEYTSSYKHKCAECLKDMYKIEERRLYCIALELKRRTVYSKSEELERRKFYEQLEWKRVYKIVHKEENSGPLHCLCGVSYREGKGNKTRHEHTETHEEFIIIANMLKKLICHDCSRLVLECLPKGKYYPIRYYDYDEKDVKELKLRYTVIKELHYSYSSNHSVFNALKLMRVI